MAKPKRKEDANEVDLPTVLPLMALRSTIVYPLGTIAVQMGAPENLALLNARTEPGLIVALVVASSEQESGGELDLYRFVGRVGVVARIHERINLPGETVQITLQGLKRIILDDIQQTEPYPEAVVQYPNEIQPDSEEVDDLIAQIVAASEVLAELVERIPDEVPAILKMNVSDPGRFADLAATNMNFRIADKDEVLQRLDIGQRLRFLLTRLEREVARAKVVEDVKRQTEIKIEQHQREFYLRQQLRAIQSELGESDPTEKESVQLLKRIEEANLPEKALEEAKRENERLRMLSPASSEYQVIRNYLDWILSLPWNDKSGAPDIELKTVQEALDSRHYGLNDVKERIIEYLAVRKLRKGHQLGPILCFMGPPGTGKTSLGEAIATAIGREFYRISVGGVRDEAEIRGHRRTYVGAMPGMIIQALRRVQVRDPVLMIDEVDKMTGGGPSGDPTSAMLEVLDPAQNKTFVDHYLNLPFDLSSVLFICTANNIFDIPAPLRDRMEVIKVSGYTIEEKVEIAWRYMLPKLLEEHGIDDRDIQFTDETLAFIASRYSREAGLRNFERKLSAIMRKRARRKAEGEEGAWVIDVAKATEILGAPRYAVQEAEMEPEIGAVTGLAWTSTGGDLMQIEALRMSGSGRLIVTGQLGDVMRESVDAAYSYVRARAHALKIDNDEFKDSDIHIHFPAGAIPKDGPSAGAAVTLAIASVLSRRAVRRDLALTGEVTLRGKVLEIGGVKEKVLAAYRAGLRQIILPKSNEKDLRDIPEEVTETMQFTFVSTMDEIFHLALLPHPEPKLVDMEREPDGDIVYEDESTPPATNKRVSKNRKKPLIDSIDERAETLDSTA